ncbi:hypothetical protein WJX73_000187 [Symbiochloris irregularis]
MRRGFLAADVGRSSRKKDGAAAGSQPAVASLTPAEEGLQALKLHSQKWKSNTRMNPPNMDWMFELDYEGKTVELSKAAVEALQNLYDEVDSGIPSELCKLLMPTQNPNRRIDGHRTVLHRLMDQDYPPAVSIPRQEEYRTHDSLPELLRTASPNLVDAKGNTVLHILLERSIKGKYFPDDSTSGYMARQEGPPDNWADRAEYVEPAFRQLVGAGWSLDTRNHAGITPADLLR